MYEILGSMSCIFKVFDSRILSRNTNSNNYICGTAHNFVDSRWHRGLHKDTINVLNNNINYIIRCLLALLNIIPLFVNELYYLFGIIHCEIPVENLIQSLA